MVFTSRGDGITVDSYDLQQQMKSQVQAIFFDPWDHGTLSWAMLGRFSVGPCCKKRWWMVVVDVPPKAFADQEIPGGFILS